MNQSVLERMQAPFQVNLVKRYAHVFQIDLNEFQLRLHGFEKGLHGCKLGLHDFSWICITTKHKRV